MKRLLYLSCHSVLEYDELTLFTELGYDCFSCGAYVNPEGHQGLPRPGIKGMKRHKDWEEIATKYPKTNLPQEFFDDFDIIIIMHQPEWVTENWGKLKGKRVIWRSIGQSTEHVENAIRKARYEGLQIVRYSPLEKNIPGYLGEDAMIRFYKDPEEFKDWTGDEKRVINMTQSLKARKSFCHHDNIMNIIKGFPALIYGSGNDNLGSLNGGEVPYDLMKGALRDNRVFVYGGTWPACYTLSFVEAMMTGIPIVTVGRELAEQLDEVPPSDRIWFFEVPNIIKNGENGFISDKIDELRDYTHQLLEKKELAERIGAAGRVTAIELFGKDMIRKQWEKFLDGS